MGCVSACVPARPCLGARGQAPPRSTLPTQRPRTRPVLSATLNAAAHEAQGLCDCEATLLSRRAAVLGSCAGLLGLSQCKAAGATPDRAPADTTITHKVFLDIGIAPTALKPAGERTLGDRSSIPIEDAAPVGRIVIGLYGNHVPLTVANFLALVRSGALEGTVFTRVLPGEYIQAGQQGQKKMGQLEPPPDVQLNSEVSSSSAFSLQHSRPGTVSLSLAENDDEPRVKSKPGYGNLEFLITTGPGPVPRLDGLNIPFGRVVEGMGVVSTITMVPTFRANERTSALNILAGQLGDGRAAGVRRKYGRPFKAVIILKAGELPV